MQHPLFEKHRATLDRALEAIATRGYWTPYPESPSPRNYGEGAAAAGKAAFDALANQRFPLTQPGTTGQVGAERSPYGIKLGITYPKADIDGLMAAIETAQGSWRKAGPEAWVGVSLEILDRINKASFEIANAVMHTTGQAFVMAFQAGGPHAQDRGLEAVAYAWDQMRRVPGQATWEKPQGKGDPVRMEKQFRVVPRGVALVIGCSTFPTWNGYPAIFASLATGNAVIVKPHPNAILPLAITVRIAREVLRDAGFDPNVVTLVAHDAGDDTAQGLALRPEVKIVDFTGSTANGRWLEEHARQAQVYTEKAGVNQVIVDSTDDLKGLVRNLAFSLALYTGQMCTAPQNVYLPADGVQTDEGHKTVAEVASGIGAAFGKLLGDDARAVELLGGVVNDGVLSRLEGSGSRGTVLVESRAVRHPTYDGAVVRTPTLIGLSAADADVYESECFGPVAYLIETSGTDESIDLFRSTVLRRGAMTAAVYSTAPAVVEQMRSAALDAGVALSENLTGSVFVNQSAAFSDFHGTGANPAANASFTDTAFVANRFRMVQSRRHV